MANSIQTSGSKFESFNDSDLIALLIFLKYELIKNNIKNKEIIDIIEKWNLAYINSGPGTIDLDLDSVFPMRENFDEFQVFLANVEHTLKGYGAFIPKVFFEHRCNTPHHVFGDYSVERLLKTLSGVTNLLKQ